MKKRIPRHSSPPSPDESAPALSVESNPTIVGVGASAGGLEAFTRLVDGLRPDAGLAYVLVQHLARDQASFLPELLGRSAAISVEQARDGTLIRANCAYVIPPDRTMTVTDGHLRLAARPAGRGLHLPIDTFLASLANVHGANAIAVILSGAGSDGARGVEAIKEMGGITFAQDSESAGHPNMPEAAIATGCVDFVLPPEKIAERLSQLGRHVESLEAAGQAKPSSLEEDEDRIEILKLLARRSGVDFAQYRRGTVHRRIVRRMLVHHKGTPAEYLALVRRDPGELDLLYEDLLIGVSGFFRDPEVFAELRATAFPALIAARPPGTPIRVWVAGCSGGEETYSFAIALTEFLEETGTDLPLQMFGTDLSEAAVARARAGVYPASIAENVSDERLRRFFVPDHDRFRINHHIRDLCVFSRQNIVRDPPFSHLDIVSCRNVLIYFETALQRRVFPIFHYALEPHGILVLGNSESPGAVSDLFEPISKGHKIYRRTSTPIRTLDLDFSAQHHGIRQRAELNRHVTPVSPAAPRGAEDLAGELDRLILDTSARQGVVIGEDFEILHVRGNVAPYIALQSGSATLDLLRLVRPELAIPLRTLVDRVATEGMVASERNIAVTDGDATRHAAIDVYSLRTSRRPRLFAVFFSADQPSSVPDAPQPGQRNGRETPSTTTRGAPEFVALREELAATKNNLREIVHQHASTLEELHSAAEEIQSSNEELQSTNEELETTKEEVQSTNEELTTLNDELRRRNQELSELASDLSNVFASTTLPIVIVGRDLRLRRFTPGTSRVLRVLPIDMGRPIGDIKLNFDLPNLEELITNAVDTLELSEHIIRDDTGTWWSLAIRPYQTLDRRVDGAVLVFNDIDKPKRAEEQASETSEERRQALVTAEDARLVTLARTNEALSRSLADRDRAQAERNVLLRQMSTAQEEERQHLSRELHDEAGQHLTALALGLRALSGIAPPGSDIDRRVGQLDELADTLGKEIHRIALRLRPKALDDFGLGAAVSGYAHDWSLRSGIAAEVQVNDDTERLPTATESAAYRVVQEALTNVARHSGATRTSVVIERRDGHLHIIVEDDGRGFEPHSVMRSPDARKGLGLLGLRERVEQLNGTVDIESAHGEGTTLFVRIPLDGSGVDQATTTRAPANDG